MATELEFDFGHPAPSKTAAAPASGRKPSASAPLSITEVTRQIRVALQRAVGDVWVEGEISNHREQASGHHYFTLKDSRAQLSCVLFRARAGFLRFPLREGMLVRVQGEINVYEPRGQYQLIARTVQMSGEGALQLQYEKLKARLAAEGLFDQDRKKPLPLFPRTVALVTSPTGAALRDMIQVLRRRAPWVHLIVCPARVQGDGAAREIAAQIEIVSTASGKSGFPTVDTIIVGRGGGSIEDLWAFNDEPLARVLAACPVPVVAAVGHEIDFTIADFVADLRAPTPSAAAELAAPDGDELRARVRSLRNTLRSRVHAQIADSERRIARYSGRGLGRTVTRALDRHSQSLDLLRSALHQAAAARVLQQERRLASLASRLTARSPRTTMVERQATLAALRTALGSSLARALESRGQRLAQARTALRTLDPRAVLSRGYSLTTTRDGTPIKDPTTLAPGTELATTYAHGRSKSTLVSAEANDPD